MPPSLIDPKQEHTAGGQADGTAENLWTILGSSPNSNVIHRCEWNTDEETACEWNTNVCQSHEETACEWNTNVYHTVMRKRPLFLVPELL